MMAHLQRSLRLVQEWLYQSCISEREGTMHTNVPIIKVFRVDIFILSSPLFRTQIDDEGVAPSTTLPIDPLFATEKIANCSPGLDENMVGHDVGGQYPWGCKFNRTYYHTFGAISLTNVRWWEGMCTFSLTQVDGSLGSMSSLTQTFSVHRAASSRENAFLITTYPFSRKNSTWSAAGTLKTPQLDGFNK